MSDNIRECQAVGAFLARLLAREFPGVQAAFICVSAGEGPLEETVEAPTVTGKRGTSEASLPAPPE